MYYSKHRVLTISIIIPEEACIALIKPPGAAEYTLKKIFDFLKQVLHLLQLSLVQNDTRCLLRRWDEQLLRNLDSESKVSDFVKVVHKRQSTSKMCCSYSCLRIF